MEMIAQALMPVRGKLALGQPTPPERYTPALDELLFFKAARERPLKTGLRRLLKRAFFPMEALVYIDPETFCRKAFAEVWRAQLEARKAGGLAGPYQFVRLMELAALIRYFRPASYLELGSGASSCLVAQLLGDAAAFTTVEESDHWHQRFRQYAAPFLDRMTSLRLDRETGVRAGELLCWYRMDHARYYDLVYVDGPSTRVQGNAVAQTHLGCGNMADYDVGLFWEQKVYPRVVVIDNRKPSLRRLLLDQAGRYDVYFNSTVREGLRLRPPIFSLYHHVLVRKPGVSACAKS